MPVLRKKSDSNQIIAGRKRLLVFRELKIAEIPSIVYEFQELSDILERLSERGYRKIALSDYRR